MMAIGQEHEATGQKKLSESDIQNVEVLDSVEMSVGYAVLTTVLCFDGTMYPVKASLTKDERPKMEFGGDSSATGWYSFSKTTTLKVKFQGEYELASTHGPFKLTIDSQGYISRVDFSANEAWTHNHEQGFILQDPNTSKYSTFVFYSDELLIEFSPNGGGKVQVWKKSG